MQIQNKYPGTPPLKCQVILEDGEQYSMSCMSSPLIDLPEDAVEVLVNWTGPDYSIDKVWTKSNGWLEVAEYQERKQFEAEKVAAEVEKQKRAEAKRVEAAKAAKAAKPAPKPAPKPVEPKKLELGDKLEL